MTHLRGLVLLGAGLLALLALRALTRPTVDRRNFEVFTEMAYSPALGSQSASAFLPGGRTQQALVPGVVARGRLPFPNGPGPEEARRAGAELVDSLPAPGSAEAEADRARGVALYATFCTVCHGADGTGGGSVVRRGMLPPPSLLGARAVEMRDGEMVHVLTRGQGNMASYAAQLSELDRWRVVRHVRSLQEAAR